MLQTAHLIHRLAAARYCEIEPTLDQAISRAWAGTWSNHFNTVNFQRASRDIWELISQGNDARLLQSMLDTFPIGALLIIIAGFPCQDLTNMGTSEGILGILGSRSVLFFAIPLITHLIQELRPDLIIHLLLENTNTMLEIHRNAICDSLNVSTREDGGYIQSNAHAWMISLRSRLLFSTLPLPFSFL